jgi:hypothetical protein
MRHRHLALVLLAAALPALACTQSTPADPTPSPTPSPQPTASPTPVAASPSPSPSSAPPSQPAVYVTAGVHSYRRKNQLVRHGANLYLAGDAIYLNCSPRDRDGNLTPDHGDVLSWSITSPDLKRGSGPGVGDFHFTGTDSFNPHLHIHDPLSRPSGTIRASCLVRDLPRSNAHGMKIQQKK